MTLFVQIIDRELGTAMVIIDLFNFVARQLRVHYINTGFFSRTAIFISVGSVLRGQLDDS